MMLIDRKRLLSDSLHISHHRTFEMWVIVLHLHSSLFRRVYRKRERREYVPCNNWKRIQNSSSVTIELSLCRSIPGTSCRENGIIDFDHSLRRVNWCENWCGSTNAIDLDLSPKKLEFLTFFRAVSRVDKNKKRKQQCSIEIFDSWCSIESGGAQLKKRWRSMEMRAQSKSKTTWLISTGGWFNDNLRQIILWEQPVASKV